MPMSEMNSNDTKGLEIFRPTHIMVTIRNLIHIRATFGSDIAILFAQGLRQRAHLGGASISALVDDSFLLSFDRVFPARMVVAPYELECWLIYLTRQPVECRNLYIHAAISVNFASVNEWGIPDISEINQISAAPETLLLPVQHNAQWRKKYEIDMSLATNFYHSLATNHFFLDFQPVVSVSHPQNELYHEALIRTSSEGITSTLKPGSIEALERLGLIRYLDRCVLMTTIDVLRNNNNLIIGCNISSQSAVIDAWWSTILFELSINPDIASRLIIEITEISLIPDLCAAISFVEHFQMLGCRIALDDFGAGTATIELARRAKPDIVKIDKGYLDRARAESSELDTLNDLIRLCLSICRIVVVEGIETSKDISLISQKSEIWGQGYLFGKPGPISKRAEDRAVIKFTPGIKCRLL